MCITTTYVQVQMVAYVSTSMLYVRIRIYVHYVLKLRDYRDSTQYQDSLCLFTIMIAVARLPDYHKQGKFHWAKLSKECLLNECLNE